MPDTEVKSDSPSLAVGSIGEFNPRNGVSWEIYAERLTLYLTANRIVDDKVKAAILLTLCGNETYEIVRLLVSPSVPSSKTFAELLAVLKKHFAPKPSEIVERFQFNKRDQNNGESIATYVAELRKLAKNCNFGEKLDEHLRDRLVCGVKSEAIQRRLLAETELTLKMAYDAAIVTEAAATAAQTSVNVGTTVTDVISVNRGRFNLKQHVSSKSACFRCGGKHDGNQCRFKTEACRFCTKIGHIERVCPKKMALQSVTTDAGSPNKLVMNFTINGLTEAI